MVAKFEKEKMAFELEKSKAVAKPAPRTRPQIEIGPDLSPIRVANHSPARKPVPSKTPIKAQKGTSRIRSQGQMLMPATENSLVANAK